MNRGFFSVIRSKISFCIPTAFMYGAEVARQKGSPSELQISSMSGGDNELFVEGYVNKHPCKIIIDTGANVTIVRTDVAQELNETLRWTPPCVTLHTVTGDKIAIEGKINITISFGNETYQHLAFVADITDEVILGLDFLRKYDFTLDFKRNKMHSEEEDIPVFEVKNSIPSACKVFSLFLARFRGVEVSMLDA